MLFIYKNYLSKKDIFNELIKEKLLFSYHTDVSRIINSLKEKGFVDLITKCPKCGMEYKKIPIICENEKCKARIIKGISKFRNGKHRPYYIIISKESLIKQVNDFVNSILKKFLVIKRRLKDL